MATPRLPKSQLTKKTCSIDGCEDIVSCRGWCEKHYNRWRRHGNPNTTLVIHGRRTKPIPERTAFHGAKARCTNPKEPCYPRYGGRGIEFRFDSFEEFFVEVGPKPTPEHSLDRKDVDGHYEPGNVRWATQEEQQRNRRDNRLLTLGDVTKPLCEWAEATNISDSTLRERLQLGWCVSCTLRVPSGGGTCVHKLAYRRLSRAPQGEKNNVIIG